MSAASPTAFESYQGKHARTRLKIHRMLGSSKVPLDVSAAEITRSGLKALLVSTVPLAYFMHYLLSTFSPELLCAYLDIDCYEKSNFKTLHDRTLCARKIYRTYFDPRSFLELNVCCATKKEIQARMNSDTGMAKSCTGPTGVDSKSGTGPIGMDSKSGTGPTGMDSKSGTAPIGMNSAKDSHYANSNSHLIHCFTAAKLHVLTLLETSFALFLKSDFFKLLKSDEVKCAFCIQARQRAYLLLQSNIVGDSAAKKNNGGALGDDKVAKNQRDGTLGDDSVAKNQRAGTPGDDGVARRNRYVGTLIMEFCKRILKMNENGPVEMNGSSAAA